MEVEFLFASIKPLAETSVQQKKDNNTETHPLKRKE
jgi:hypothetical protein